MTNKSFQDSPPTRQLVGAVCHFLSEIIQCAVIENHDGGLDTFSDINMFLQAYLLCSNSLVIGRMTRERGLPPDPF